MNMFNDETMLLTEENLASWLDGMMSPEEEERFLAQCEDDSDLAGLLDANDDITDSYETILTEGYEIPAELISDFDLPEITMVETPLFDESSDDNIFNDQTPGFSEDRFSHSNINEDGFTGGQSHTSDTAFAVGDEESMITSENGYAFDNEEEINTSESDYTADINESEETDTGSDFFDLMI